ncbi:hypothetical protein NP233_g11039 [Leucocoprinus birnbaumii]|uniref:Uncharacterized protein n=1 Tax=Leucocoprinus birnbaumii TaxID=56174 RepID=A0AAD5YRB6_9AGAR|nr:hypothetical protein NP233_g11039 [Leucocoprinus birnbaumii]
MASHRYQRVAKDDEDIFGDDDRHNLHKTKLPVIPDLRFEYSYARSVRPYVHVERLDKDSVSPQQQHHSSAEELLSDYEKVEIPGQMLRGDAGERGNAHNPRPSTGPKEIVHVQWKKVIWATTRDQVISPFLQGALWAVLSYFLTPYSRSLGSKLGHLVHAKAPPKEGNAAAWLRSWVKSLGLTAKSTEESKR